MLEQSAQFRAANFTVIGTDDLERMFALYDREFFRGLLGEMLMEDYAHPMTFRLSRRLTRAAGQTMRQVRRVPVGGKMAERVDYEISVSTTLLFSTFQNVEREVIVGGLLCHDRLEALQRIFEHELLHLAEFLGWGRSSCSAENFHVLSRRIFAHEGVSHDLVTPREQAAVAFDVRVGDQVSFEARGLDLPRPRQPDHPPRHRPDRKPPRRTLLRRPPVPDLLCAPTLTPQAKLATSLPVFISVSIRVADPALISLRWSVACPPAHPPIQALR